MKQRIERLLGGAPLHVAGRLLLISMIVGAGLSFIGWEMGDVVDSILNFINGIWQHGWESVVTLAGYIVKGAILVIPIWLISRLRGPKS